MDSNTILMLCDCQDAKKVTYNYVTHKNNKLYAIGV